MLEPRPPCRISAALNCQHYNADKKQYVSGHGQDEFTSVVSSISPRVMQSGWRCAAAEYRPPHTCDDNHHPPHQCLLSVNFATARCSGDLDVSESAATIVQAKVKGNAD